MEEYINSIENWINQEENRLQQAYENRRYLTSKIDLELKELEFINKNIEHTSKWLESTKNELKQYCEENKD